MVRFLWLVGAYFLITATLMWVAPNTWYRLTPGVAAMGNVVELEEIRAHETREKLRGVAPVVVEANADPARDSATLTAHEGEIVGLAGLRGAGQKQPSGGRVQVLSNLVQHFSLLDAVAVMICLKATGVAVEAAAEGGEELLDKYLESGELSDQEIRQGLRTRTLANEIVPIRSLCPPSGIPYQLGQGLCDL